MNLEAKTLKQLSPGFTWIALLLIVLGGFSLRSTGTSWGKGLGAGGSYVQFHPDEPRFIEIARGLHEDVPYRKSYVLGYAHLLRGALVVSDLQGIELSDPELIGVARGISEAAGLALIFLTFLIVRRLSDDDWTALLAGGLVALNTWCVTHSTYGTADMLYTSLLYLFAWGVLRSSSSQGVGWAFMVAVVAGAAMATKFGVVLWPSLLLLAFLHPSKRAFLLLGLPAVALLSFLVVQGFAFDRESIAAIHQSLTRDNLSGFQHPKGYNFLIYAVQLVRVLGLPVAVFTLVGWWVVRKESFSHRWFAVAFLPILLHGVGMLALSTSFPRHLVPLLPFLLILAAFGLRSRRGWGWSGVALLWSVLLATSDAAAIWKDSRVVALYELGQHVNQETTVWASPYYKVPHGCKGATAREADILVLHEGWTFRFERSELNPFQPPREGVYHGRLEELAWYQELEKGLANGRVELLYRAQPPVFLPEQLLYRAWWGNLNKFAGETRLLRQQPSSL